MDWLTHTLAFSGGIAVALFRFHWRDILNWMDRRDEAENDRKFGD